VWAFFLGMWQRSPGDMLPFLGAILLCPLAAAALGVLIGTWKSHMLRGGLMGGLAGVPVAVVVALTVTSIDGQSGAPDRRTGYAHLLSSLLDLEKHEETVQAAQEFAAAFPDMEAAYDSASFIARSVPVAEKDARLTPEQRRTVVEEYGRLAVQQLRRAIELGFRDVHRIRLEPNLDRLRKRQDFQDLLTELEAP